MRYVDCVGTPQERLERGLVRQPNGCLEWQGAHDAKGYGMIRANGKVVRTHRLAWSLVNGPIPVGQLIRHFVCDNPPCCDETHLRPGAGAENAADKFAHGRGWQQAVTHCPQDHAYDEANTYVDSTGRRHCRACIRSTTTRTRARNKALKLADRDLQGSAEVA